MCAQIQFGIEISILVSAIDNIGDIIFINFIFYWLYLFEKLTATKLIEDTKLLFIA